MLRAGGGRRPNIPAQTQQNIPPPDLGTGTPGGPANLSQPASLTPQQGGAAVLPSTDQSKLPALAGFLTQMFGGQNQRGFTEGAPGQPARPVSRLDSFENFVG